MTKPLNADGTAPSEDNDPFGLNLPTTAAPLPPPTQAPPPPDTAEPVVEKAPEVIKADDPLGRQPGDPNDTIDLPPDVLGGPPKLGLNFGSSDRPMTLDELEAAHIDALKDVQPLERRPDVATDNVRQDPDLSEKTQMEMAMGRRAREEASTGNFTPAPATPGFVAPDANRASGAAFATPQSDGARSYSQAPTITSSTLAEQEAGRAAVARKSTDAAYGQDVMRRAAAKRLAEGAPADAGDLNYVIPRG